MDGSRGDMLLKWTIWGTPISGTFHIDSPDLFGIGDGHPQHESSLPKVGHQITIVVPKVTVLELPQLIHVGLLIAPLRDTAGGLGLGDGRSSRCSLGIFNWRRSSRILMVTLRDWTYRYRKGDNIVHYNTDIYNNIALWFSLCDTAHIIQIQGATKVLRISFTAAGKGESPPAWGQQGQNIMFLKLGKPLRQSKATMCHQEGRILLHVPHCCTYISNQLKGNIPTRALRINSMESAWKSIGIMHVKLLSVEPWFHRALIASGKLLGVHFLPKTLATSLPQHLENPCLWVRWVSFDLGFRLCLGSSLHEVGPWVVTKCEIQPWKNKMHQSNPDRNSFT